MKICHVQSLIDSAMPNLSNKMQSSNHCLIHLQPPIKPFESSLKDRRHDFQLSAYKKQGGPK